MEIGSENRTKLIAAVALMVVALALLGNWIFGSPGGAPSTTETATAAPPPLQDEAQAAAPARSTAHGKKAGTGARSLDPSLRYDWLKSSEDTEYKGAGRNIFAAQMEIPKPIASAVPDKHAGPALPPVPPPPPPIDLKFFGFASRPGEPKKVFLSQGEDVFIAIEGEIIDRRYKVLRISPMSVEIEDVLNNNRQQIQLTQGAG
jgi:hypothetical protein